MIKKLFNVFLISLITLGNYFILPAKKIRAAGSDIRINEVAPNETGGQDWIEFYVAQDGDYGEYEVYERGIVIKVFPADFVLEAGDFIVLHIDQDGDDEITDENENGYLDIYSSDSGLVGTDNVITVRDEDNNIVDALCFSNNDDIWAGLQQDAFNEAVESGQWTGTIDGDILNEKESVDWSEGEEGYSLGRDIDSSDTDSGSVAANDWDVKEFQTKGFLNRENLESEIASVEADPGSFILGEEESILFIVEVYDEDGLGDIESVNIDLSEIGGESDQEMYDDGSYGDEEIADGVYSFEYDLPADIEFGNFEISINVLDSMLNEVGDSIEIEINEPTYSDQIIINEVLPNPEGSDIEGEFIELYNKGSERVDLEGWRVGDSSTKYTISGTDYASTEIDAHGYFVVNRNISGISLNNTGGETVNLYQPNDDLLDTISYSESAAEDQSYSLGGGLWQWSIESTSGEVNNIVLENHNPEAVLDSDIEAEVGDQVILDGTDSFDPDEDELSYEWDFGDGSNGAGSKTNHIYSEAGTYNVELTVSDGRGGEDSDSLKIVVKESDEENNNLNSSNDLDEDNISGPFSHDIVISEVLPNPEGSDTVDEGEFIEIYNKGSVEVNLNSWQIDDEEGGSSPYTIEDQTIKSGEYKVFYRGETKISLNNSDEKAKLIYPDGEVASEVYYEESAKDDYAYALNSSNDYKWTNTPTPGEENIFNSEEENNEESDNNSEEEDNISNSARDDSNELSNNETSYIAIKEARTKDKNTEVEVRGVVISEPGLFSKKTFYIQDSTSGIQIYFSKEDFPKIELGDEVNVKGKVSESGNEKKINISQEGDVEVLGHKSIPQPKESKTGDINEDLEGQLVRVAGEIVKTSGNVFYLDDGSGQTKIYVNSNTGINKPKMEKGDKYTIIGVESETSSGYRVLPRYQSDIREGLDGTLASASGEMNGSIPQTGSNMIVLLILSFFSAGYVLLPKWAYKINNER